MKTLFSFIILFFALSFLFGCQQKDSLSEYLHLEITKTIPVEEGIFIRAELENFSLDDITLQIRHPEYYNYSLYDLTRSDSIFLSTPVSNTPIRDLHLPAKSKKKLLLDFYATIVPGRHELELVFESQQGLLRARTVVDLEERIQFREVTKASDPLELPKKKLTEEEIMLISPHIIQGNGAERLFPEKEVTLSL